MKKYLWLIIIILSLSVKISAEEKAPISWSTRFSEKGNGDAELYFTADIALEWHLFGTQISESGPKPTRLVLEKCDGAKLDGELLGTTPASKEYNSLLELVLNQYTIKAIFRQAVKITSYPVNIIGYIEYQASTKKTCLPPTKYKFSVNIPATANILAKEASKEIVSMPVTNIDNNKKSVLKWKSVNKQVESLTNSEDKETTTYRTLIKRGFRNGLFALFIPCLWPVIMLSIYNFRKMRTTRKRLLLRILSYDIAILVIYPLAALLIAQIFGTDIFMHINENIYFNIGMFILMLLLAGSLFGAVRTKENRSALGRISFLSILVLVLSLSCTGRFIGQTVKDSISLDVILGPLTVFFGFISAFVVITTLISTATNWERATLESKERLRTINRVAGFFILAYSLTYISYIDLSYGYNIIGREVFLVILIAIFGSMGMYLLNMFRFLRDKTSTTGISVKRFICSIGAFSFCIYLIPGLWGAPLNAISILLPPQETQDFNLYENSTDHIFTNYYSGMKYAKENLRPAIISFSAISDAESRRTNASLWSFSPIRGLIKKDFVIITLNTDSKEKLPYAKRVKVDNKYYNIDTYGELWSALQKGMFESESRPYQVVLSPDGEPLSGAISHTESAKQYFEFLLDALRRHRKQIGWEKKEIGN